MDELGVLVAGHAKNAYWFGSQLSIAEARRHVRDEVPFYTGSRASVAELLDRLP